ncbi:hypothetical protein HYDPIDRAFT_107085 [Hydnomerulius pinastri MD-312]|nr:hypothetical protein HYDPIDRAFT_107085 [Hydnomerulius pinastri MD-312]
MSGKNRVLTIAIILMSSVQVVTGMVSTFGISDDNISLRTALTGATAALCVSCDALITVSVYYYLRPRAGVRRTQNQIQRIITVTINMGLLTWSVALGVLVVWCKQGPDPTIVTPIIVMGPSYVNSILGVLNARKPMRSAWRGLGFQSSSIQLPTLPTIHIDSEP